MGQKYPSSKAQYQSSVEDSSLWVCCVSTKGNRKKVYAKRSEANKDAKVVNGRSYRCVFNPETFHVTTTETTKMSSFVDKKYCENLKNTVEKIDAEMEIIKTRVARMTGDTPLEEIKATTAKWNQLADHKAVATRLIEHKERNLTSAVFN
jgi:hypothetical protein